MSSAGEALRGCFVSSRQAQQVFYRIAALHDGLTHLKGIGLVRAGTEQDSVTRFIGHFLQVSDWSGLMFICSSLRSIQLWDGF